MEKRRVSGCIFDTVVFFKCIDMFFFLTSICFDVVLDRERGQDCQEGGERPSVGRPRSGR